MDDPGFQPRHMRGIFLTGAYLASYLISTRVLSRGVKRQGREADQFHPSVQVKNKWIYTSAPPMRFTASTVTSYFKCNNHSDKANTHTISRKENGKEPEDIQMNGQRYENLETFKYLGLLINTKEVKAEIKAIIFAGNTLQWNGPFTEGKIRNK